MSDKYKRNEGDRIYFDITGDGKLSGFGIICGCASAEVPTLGRNWLIKLEENNTIDKTVYPFSCISVFDNQIKDPPQPKNI